MNRPYTLIQEGPYTPLGAHRPSLLRIRVLVELREGLYRAQSLDTNTALVGEDLPEVRLRFVRALEEQLFRVGRDRSEPGPFNLRVDSSLSRKWYAAAHHSLATIALHTEASAVAVFAFAKPILSGKGRRQRTTEIAP